MTSSSATDLRRGRAIATRYFEAVFHTPPRTVRVRTDDADVARTLEALLAPLRTASTRNEGRPVRYDVLSRPTTRNFVVRRGRLRLGTAATVAGVVDTLLIDLNKEWMWETSRDLAIHAGAVSWRGQGIVLPAAMDSGKTTLTAALVRAGLDYLTDECTVLDPEKGWLVPFPRPLVMEPETLELFPELVPKLQEDLLYPGRLRYPIAPDDIRQGCVGGPCPLRWVISPRYDRRGGTELMMVSRAEGAMLLLENSLTFGRVGGEAVSIVERALRDASCFRLRVDDLDVAVDTVTGLLAS